MKPAEKTDRIIHYMTDNLMITLIALIISIILCLLFFPELESQTDILQTEPARSQFRLLFLCVFLIYYISFEGFLGKTPGKMVTGSFVLGNKGLKPRWWQVILRTLLRLTGIDILSFLFGVQLGLHDVLSKTIVVSSNTELKTV
jgi:uncharacterized RDD family membrane protein YckC